MACLQSRTNASLLFGLPVQLNSSGQYDPRINATALWSATEQAGYKYVPPVPIPAQSHPNSNYRCRVAGWSLGNELIGGEGFNSTTYAVDYRTFAKALVNYAPAVGQALFGPSAAGFPGSDVLAPFIQARAPPLPALPHPVSNLFAARFACATQGAAPLLSGLTFHAYAFKNCSLTVYASKTGVERMAYYYSSYASLRDELAPGLPLINEEAATQAGGGCEGLSDRFVSGFWWVHSLGLAAAAGIARVHRQDVAGFSFNGRPSHYQLAGAAGWINATISGPLTPHPDWYATVLHKQLVGTVALSATLAASPSVNASVAVHAWCTASVASAPSGSITFSFVNMGPDTVALQLLTGAMLPARVEYFVQAEGSSDTSAAARGSSPPQWLASDAILLNGAPLSVDNRGRLPAYPIPGRPVPVGTPSPQLPPWSYGFIVLPEAAAPACMAH